MTRRRPLLILMLLATLTLALPASPALAQSAGDDQYQDPLGGNDTSGGGGNDTSGGNDSTPSRPAQSGGGNTAPSAPAQAPKATRSVPLARTGFNAWIPGVAGLILLVAGASLLVRTRRRPS